MWSKYYLTKDKPKDSLQMVQLILDKIQLQHAGPKHFFDSLTNQVYELKKFILEKKLAEEKYHRATVSQVQLCSYYTGATAIQSLRGRL